MRKIGMAPIRSRVILLGRLRIAEGIKAFLPTPT